MYKDKNYYGSRREVDIELIYKFLEVGELYDFKEILIIKGDFFLYVYGEGKVEFVFFIDILFDVVKFMFNMKEKSIDKFKYFNCIFFDFF